MATNDRKINFTLGASNEDALRKAKEAENQFYRTGKAAEKSADDTRQKWERVTEELRKAYGIIGKMSERARYITGNGQQAYHRETNTSGLNTEFNDHINNLNSNIKDLRNLIKSQQNIVNRSISRNHMTATQFHDYNSNNNAIAGFTRQRGSAQSELDRLLSTRGVLATQRDHSTNEDEKRFYNERLRENNEEIKAQREYVKRINEATDSLRNFDSTLRSSNVNVEPERGSLAYNLRQRGFAIGARLTAGASNVVSGYYKSGLNTNMQTGQQAIQLGYLTGGGTDYQVRRQVQAQGAKYGYGTQQAQDFYSEAIRRSGPAMTMREANKNVAEVMKQGRASNLSDSDYGNLVNAVAGANSGTDKNGIKNIVSTVLAANAMSGQSGNYQQNAQTYTALLNQIGSNINVSNKGAQQLAVNQSTLSTLGGAFKGNAGAQNTQTINNAFLSASKGQNPALLYSIIQSQGQGGLKGNFDARLIAERGLSDVRSVTSMRSTYGRMAQSGENGKYRAALAIQNTMGIGPKAAMEMAEGFANGKLSDTQIQKRAEAIDKKGKTEDKNSNYAKSNYKITADRVTVTSNNQSKMADNNSWVEKLGRAVANMGPFLQILGGIGLSNSLLGGNGLGGGLFKSAIEKFTGKPFGSSGKRGKGLTGGLLDLFTGGKGKHTDVGTGAGNATKSGGLGSKIKGAWNSTKDFFTASYAADGTPTNEAAKRAMARKAAQATGEVAGDATKVSKGTGIVSKITGGFGKAFNFVKSKGSNLIGKGASLVSKIPGAGTVGKFIGKGANLVSKIPGAGFIGKLGGKLGGKAIPLVGEGLMAIDAIRGIGDIAKNPINALKHPIKSVGSIFGLSRVNDTDEKKQSKKSSSKKSSSSKKGYTSTQAALSFRQQNSLLDKEKQIVNNRLKYTKEQQALLAGNGGKSYSKKSSSKKAFGGLVKGNTEIAEGNKPEFVVPTDPAKKNSTQRVVNDIANMTGVKAKSDTRMVVSHGNYSPNLTVNVNGNVGDSKTLDRLQETIKTALNNATDNYRNNIRHA